MEQAEASILSPLISKVRRLGINDSFLINRIKSPHLRSALFFDQYFERELLERSPLSKWLGEEDYGESFTIVDACLESLRWVSWLCSLIHLRFLSLGRCAFAAMLPSFISKLRELGIRTPFIVENFKEDSNLNMPVIISKHLRSLSIIKNDDDHESIDPRHLTYLLSSCHNVCEVVKKKPQSLFLLNDIPNSQKLFLVVWRLEWIGESSQRLYLH
ncbi:hypothetical protein SCA6_006218 [Theobroma cacao]